ncbi:MAG TPA: ATP--guanido phosphotransferase [bacterium]|nr:ATP--guanido phosphotransferase [bacterium]
MFEELLTRRDDWFAKSGPLEGVVISSRVRLARNLEGAKFPHHASALEQKEVVEKVEAGLKGLAPGGNLRFVRLNEISSLDRQFLTEHQLMSVEHAASLGERAVAFDCQEGLSFMINEEDHLRLQVFRPGLNLREAQRALERADQALAQGLPYAKHGRWGYLTACPTNLGSALRASVMLHLPALVYTTRIAQVLQGVAQVGLTIRGLQGETTQISSPFFQISNQSSMGKTHSEIVEQVDRVARQMIELETQTQKALFQQEGLKLKDHIGRALGTLKNAQLVPLEEALNGLSALRVGVEQKILAGLDLPNLNHLLILIQPAHLAKIAVRELRPEDEAQERARLLRMVLKPLEPV